MSKIWISPGRRKEIRVRSMWYDLKILTSLSDYFLLVQKKNYRLVDVGCGSGISTLCFASEYRFKDYFGFDFSRKLIDLSFINRTTFLANNSIDEEINFEVDDALRFRVNESSVLFMFNPFGCEIIREVVVNNLSKLKKTKSLIPYVNDHCIDALKEFGEVINRNEMYNLSYISF